MSPSTLLEQILNSLQFGVLLFLMSAGLTLVFGVMNFINLAHGSLYMFSAYVAAWAFGTSSSFAVGMFAGAIAGLGVALLLDVMVFRHLYVRDHLYQVLATFGLILFFNELVQVVWGATPLFSQIPKLLDFRIKLFADLEYPAYRLLIIGVGVAVAGFLYALIEKTRLGMLIRAGSSDREMLESLGIDNRLLYAAVIGLGGLLAATAGVVSSPILSVQPGMGESILILVFVVIVVGGIGSVRGAFFGALTIGFIDTFGRAFLRPLLGTLMPTDLADSAGPGLASMLIYITMAIVLVVKPKGLFVGRQS